MIHPFHLNWLVGYHIDGRWPNNRTSKYSFQYFYFWREKIRCAWHKKMHVIHVHTGWCSYVRECVTQRHLLYVIKKLNNREKMIFISCKWSTRHSDECVSYHLFDVRGTSGVELVDGRRIKMARIANSGDTLMKNVICCFWLEIPFSFFVSRFLSVLYLTPSSYIYTYIYSSSAWYPNWITNAIERQSQLE